MADLREELQPRKAKWLAFLEDVSKDGFYNDKIEDMIQKEQNRLIININDVRKEDPELARETMTSPMLEVTAAQLALKELVDTKDSAYSTKEGSFFVGFSGSFGAHHVTPRGLSADLLGRLVCVDGIVSKCSLVHPKVVKSVHYCPQTKLSLERTYRDATSIDGLPTYGLYPREDDQGNPLVTEYGYSVYKNHQRMTIQEMPERAPTGQLPRSIDVILDDDLVDTAKPGDRVQIVGIYRALPNKRGGTTSGVFRTVLLGNTVRQLEKEVQMPSLTDTDIKNILKISKRKRGRDTPFHLLARSLAPSIYGNDEIKMGILCLLLGGTEKNLKRGGHIRGCGEDEGDGGGGGVVFLVLYLLCACVRSVRTLFSSSHRQPFTAAVSRTRTHTHTLTPSYAHTYTLTPSYIHTHTCSHAQQQLDDTLILALRHGSTKFISAGIHTSLNARCSVLAAANPVYGQYDPYSTPTDNIGLPDSLLSRFDLLFIVLDKMDPEVDSKLAGHVLKSHLYRRPGESEGEALRMETAGDTVIVEPPEDEDEEETDVWAAHQPGMARRRGRARILSVDFVKKYIMYARARCQPKLTEDAAEFISDAYSTLRSREHDDKTLPVTARTLETMIRLSTAHAKSRLSQTVDRADAEVAMDLINFAYYNEAKPLAKPRKKRHPDHDDSDSDSDDGVDGGDRMPSTPKPKQKPRATATPTRKAARKANGQSDASPAKSSAFSKARSATAASGAYDPYDFDAPTTAAGEEQPAKKAKQSSSSSSATTTTAAADGDENGTAQAQEEEEEEEAAAGTAISADEMNRFKAAVLAVYKSLKHETVQISELLDALAKQGMTLTEEEARDRLAIMQENNLVYVSDDTVFLV
ncbi:hypothetical protein PTSG_04316 [Salpingoeca rosetta]|uniref:DNA replication licensing factor MCM3 n=1 Tax=Salpingoeca rosetta (strain ATCC 50818 / BSB-021) TaxID=946362 RepID=F2U872_SALR5|nr:uncharacterized protein PTSG_04316 [Salpingoeca rosetta]EGD72580.1 hypothetical protein PTSG_04316 [Salpingoeca rosetta]|eukprot:XP_004994403.1 hypothetical protein PTSG_04316 [Salpingoeca rosetta]